MVSALEAYFLRNLVIYVPKFCILLNLRPKAEDLKNSKFWYICSFMCQKCFGTLCIR